MAKPKKKTLRAKFSSNHFIIIGLMVISVWLIVTSLWDTGLLNSNLLPISPSYLSMILLLKSPIIFGSFSLAYGLGVKSNDKLGTITITVLMGILFSYIFSIPIATYVNFIRYFF
jgi:hypothetical protein